MIAAEQQKKIARIASANRREEKIVREKERILRMNLYQIDAEIMRAFESAMDPDTGEIVDAEAYAALDRLGVERDNKIENILLWIKDLKSDAEQLKKEKMAFAERQKSAERKCESLTRYVSGVLAGQKFKTEKVEASWRKSEVVIYDGDIANLPEKFKKYADPELKKTELKKALKDGEEIDGARLEQRSNLQIK